MKERIYQIQIITEKIELSPRPNMKINIHTAKEKCLSES